MKDRKLSAALVLSLAVASTGLTADGVEVTIPNAQAGECYAKVLIPAKFETHTERILQKEAGERLHVIPAKFGTAKERVLVKEASTRLSVIPATFRKESEKVLIRDEEIHWKTGLKNNIPVSPEILSAAKAGGADLDSMRVGSCYREFFTPAQYQVERQNYIARAASETLKIIPAKYETVKERVLVKEASQKVVPVPATYEYVSERILIEPEKTMWKKSQCNGRNNECGVMCLVSTPARYKTVKKKVIKTPATTRVIDIPAVYKTIDVRKLVTPAQVTRAPIPEVTKSYTRRVKTSDPVFSWALAGTRAAGKYTGHQICKTVTPAQYKTIVRTVVDQPATTKEVEIPEVYKTITVTKIITPAEVKRVVIPEEFSSITKREMVSPSRMEWKKVVCQSNMGVSTVRKVQIALRDQGYYKGPIDGIIGYQTKAALKAYQKKNNLAIGGLTYEVIKSLGASI